MEVLIGVAMMALLAFICFVIDRVSFSPRSNQQASLENVVQLWVSEMVKGIAEAKLFSEDRLERERISFGMMCSQFGSDLVQLARRCGGTPSPNQVAELLLPVATTFYTFVGAGAQSLEPGWAEVENTFGYEYGLLHQQCKLMDLDEGFARVNTIAVGWLCKAGYKHVLPVRNI